MNSKIKNIIKTILITILIFCNFFIMLQTVSLKQDNEKLKDNLNNITIDFKQYITETQNQLNDINKRINLLTELIDTNNQIQDNLVKENEAMKHKIDRDSYPFISWYNELAKKYNVDYAHVFEISQIVIKYSKKYKISSNHIMALIGVESKFKSNAKSYLGQSYGSGLCQVSDLVRQEYNWKTNSKITHNDLFDIDTNIKIACWYYSRLRDTYGVPNNVNSLMSAYNKGYKGGYAKNYVDKIQKNLSLLK